MKIYCETNNKTHTLMRVVGQVKATAPLKVEFVSELAQADLAIALTIGARDPLPFLESGIPTVLLQLCYLTAGGNRTMWRDIWRQCAMVGSYLNLADEIGDTTRFVRFPLGYDPNIFYPAQTSKFRLFGACVTGFVDGPEEIMSVIEAFGTVAHVGEPLALGRQGYHHFVNISDHEMRWVYQKSRYVIGLRRIEGFELPIIEGGACGAIPITFDLECYRRWFDNKALFIPEDDHTVDHLRRIAQERPDLAPVDWSAFKEGRTWGAFWKHLADLGFS